MWTRLLRGAAAGAAGTTALNAITYLDMAARGRPSSSTPEQTVEALSSMLGLANPAGDGDDDPRADTRSNRLQGVAALTGLGTGVAVGALFAAADDRVDGVLGRLPVGVAGMLIASAALVGANGPMAALGVTDPREWSSADWVSDLVPHLGYGLVTAFAYAAMDS
jgi:hypothetical protein